MNRFVILFVWPCLLSSTGNDNSFVEPVNAAIADLKPTAQVIHSPQVTKYHVSLLAISSDMLTLEDADPEVISKVEIDNPGSAFSEGSPRTVLRHEARLCPHILAPSVRYVGGYK